MLREELQARLMVKREMKRCNNNKNNDKNKNDGGNIQSLDVLKRVLDARQLAIKLLLNVTYGYTAAGFSGRMPMAELVRSYNLGHGRVG